MLLQLADDHHVPLSPAFVCFSLLKLAAAAETLVAAKCIAQKLTVACVMQVCHYRDKNSINKFQIAKVTADGVNISEPFAVETKWDYKVSLLIHAYK